MYFSNSFPLKEKKNNIKYTFCIMNLVKFFISVMPIWAVRLNSTLKQWQSAEQIWPPYGTFVKDDISNILPVSLSHKSHHPPYLLWLPPSAFALISLHNAGACRRMSVVATLPTHISLSTALPSSTHIDPPSETNTSGMAAINFSWRNLTPPNTMKQSKQ